MADTVGAAVRAPAWVNRPVWVDLATSDPDAARKFYSGLFGWDIQVSPDPQYGGYAQALVGGKPVAGIGPKMMAEAPTAWSVYLGTTDSEGLAKRIQAAGGTVVVPPMTVGDQGRMSVFQDPSGAFISAWEPISMAGFSSGTANAFGWAELNARGIDKDLPFYETVFGWDPAAGSLGLGGSAYTQFQIAGHTVAGGSEMNPMVPPQVPSYWMVYFGVSDLDASYKAAIAAGAGEMLPPVDYPGGRLAIVSDPQGAAFGLMQMRAR